MSHRWYGCIATVFLDSKLIFCLHFTEGKQAESARADAAEKAMKEQLEQRQKLEKVGFHNRAAADDCGVEWDVF